MTDVPLVPEPRPLSTSERLAIWLRHNVWHGRSDYVITPLALIIVGYVLYRLARFLFVTGRWEIIRVNLTLFMVGAFPRDELWRPALAVIAAAAFIGLVGGYIRSRQVLLPGFERLSVRQRALDLGVRFWPLILGVLLLLALSRTVTPWLVTAAAVGAAATGYAIGRYLPSRLLWLVCGLATAVALVFFLVQDPYSWRTWPDGARDFGGWLSLLGLVAAIALAPLLLATRRVPAALVTVGLFGSTAIVMILGDGLGWDDWGGLMLNIFLAVISITLCFPLGVLLALGRQAGTTSSSNSGGYLLAGLLAVGAIAGLAVFGWPVWLVVPIAVVAVPLGWVVGRRTTLPVIRTISTAYIEVFRGMPLFVLLLMAGVALPFFIPASIRPGLVPRAIIVFTLFTAAYVAEIVRGGLQSLPKGQTEAAQALGLSPFRVTFWIVLPQALRNVIPAMVGQFISLFKDTSLAGAALGFSDLLDATRDAPSQPQFAGQGLLGETFAFAMLLFWVGSITMSRESQRIERKLGVGTR